MREITKTITFPFSFQYAGAHGQFEEANAVTVCEPGFDLRKVHNKMAAIVGEAQQEAWRKYLALTAGQPQAEATAAVEVDAADVSEGGAADDDGPDTLAACRMGMPPEAYVSFAEFIHQQLNNNKPLAFIGSDTTMPIKDRIPVRDGEWINIARAGGVRSVNKVLSAFAGFFSLAEARRKNSGIERS